MSIGPVSSTQVRHVQATQPTSQPERSSTAGAPEPEATRAAASAEAVGASRSFQQGIESGIKSLLPFLPGANGTELPPEAGVRKPCGTGGKCISRGLQSTKDDVG